MYKKETSLSNNDKEESKPSRLQSLQSLIDGVHMLLKDATAHGRILVGPTDESGIGDEVFPAWARRQVDINLAAATTEEDAGGERRRWRPPTVTHCPPNETQKC